MKRQRASRRGVLLLIVLSLLVLFVLIAVTFVVVATQYTSAAKAYSRHELKGDDPSKELDAAVYMLLRGTRDPSDLLYRHNLLRDLYGVDGFRAQILAVSPEGGGEFLRVPFRVVTPPTTAKTVDYYSGSVLTLIDGQGRGHSTRVVRCSSVGAAPLAQGYIVVEAFEDLAGYGNGVYTSFLPRPGNRFVVNGKPFNGTGDGYNPTTGKLDWKFQELPIIPEPEVALMPNLRGAASLAASLGDSDESWDAVDYQNYFLARIPTAVSDGDPRLDADDPLIPSFHRPFLINYWIQHPQDSGAPRWDLPDFRRQVITRPIPQDHPLFTGSNPFLTAVLQSNGRLWPDDDNDTIPNVYDSDADGDGSLDDLDKNGLVDMAFINGPWDVDNDADGTADSIWVDLGMPIKTAPDGRLYKPLYAILCVDLDGRLNVNAHGVKEFEVAGTPLEELLGQQLLATAAGTPMTLDVTRGQGYGPAEIRLDTAVRDPRELPPVNTLMNRLIARRYGGYGEADPRPGYPGEFSQGVDLLSYLQQWGVPREFGLQFNANPRGSLYLTPPDLRGLGGVYLDLAGQGQYALMGLPWAGVPIETQDDPYELNLLSLQASDHPFGVDELEQLLRFGDADSLALVPPVADSLRTILSATLPPNATSWSTLRRYTTHSFDIPAANVVAPNLSLRTLTLKDDQDLPQPLLSPNPTVADLVRARLRKNGMPDPLEIERQVQLMIPPEIRNGGRMDINRWLGNGRDDTTDPTAGGFNVVDEPNDVDVSTDQPQLFWSDSQFIAPGRLALDDPNNDRLNVANVNLNNPLFSRQQYARHLYCLAMLLLDSQNDDEGTAFTLNGDSRLTARRIAQWAINAVDFSDPDAIMTPFEFDLEPFDADGWRVDDNFTTDEDSEGADRAIVWGCEFPELLITETAAFHDRRVRDTNDDNAAETAIDPAANPPVVEESKYRFPQANDMQDDEPDQQPDQDLDQYRIPQGSLFLEFYCPRHCQLQTDAIAPPELYAKQGNRLGLDLGRVVNGSPVWRVAIANPDVDDESRQAIKWPALAPDVNNDLFDPNDAGIMAGLSTDGLPDNALQLDRFIIFSSVVPSGIPGGRLAQGHRYYYYRDLNGLGPPLLEPSKYAVVGPRPLTQLTSKPTDLPGKQRIALGNNLVQHFGPDDQLVRQGAALSLVCAADPPANWSAADRTLWSRTGIGMNVSEPIPDDTYYPAPDTTGPNGQAGDLPSYYDRLEAYDPTDPGLLGLPDVPLDDRSGNPLGKPADDSEPDSWRMTGTNLQFRVALLQRLADPTRGWDATTNPYITVDSQTIDLTVYNGEEDSEKPPPGWNDAYGPYDPSDDPDDENPPEMFESRERGDNPARPLLWNPLSKPPHETTPTSVEGEYWDHTLVHSLGYLNTTFGLPLVNPPPEYAGAPQRPFPWLTWNNRPFISPLELMLVPSSPPWRLGYEFRPAGNIADRDDDFRAPFSFLLNFFHSSKTEGDGANLCRIFDYLEKPSPFVGTQKWLSPQIFSELHQKNVPIGVLADLWGFNVPFNRLSRFRDPGRININTIPDQTVWNAIDPEPNQSASWGGNGVERSLIGGSDSDRPKRPAFYANPVRSASSADLMPLDDLKQAPVEATLLRSGGSNRPLFDFSTGAAYANPDSNPYFRYHKLQRLGNLLTTHSNVYAVWITVGYFEVLPWPDPNGFATPDNAAHPDGFQLGQEMGGDTGQIKRHRAFYIIDRSIPVAFEPGENHNVDRTILLRRMIE